MGELAKAKKALDTLDTDDIAAVGHHSTISLEMEIIKEDLGECVKRELSNSFHSHNLPSHLPVSRETPAAKNLKPGSNNELDHDPAGKFKRLVRTTVTANSDPGRSPDGAKRKARRTNTNIIDQLFQGLA